MNWKKKTMVRKAWGMLSKGEGDGNRVNVPGLLKVPKQVWGNKRILCSLPWAASVLLIDQGAIVGPSAHGIGLQ